MTQRAVDGQKQEALCCWWGFFYFWGKLVPPSHWLVVYRSVCALCHSEDYIMADCLMCSPVCFLSLCFIHNSSIVSCLCVIDFFWVVFFTCLLYDSFWVQTNAEPLQKHLTDTFDIIVYGSSEVGTRVTWLDSSQTRVAYLLTWDLLD